MAVADISPSDREKIAELRERVGVHLLAEHPTFNTDFDMLRWLQGYDYDINAIVPLLRRHLLLRKVWKVDTIVEDYKHPNVVTQKCFFFGLLPTPLDAAEDDCCLVSIDCLGRIDCDGLVRSTSLMTILQRNVWSSELNMRHIREREKLTGKQSRIIDVMDLDGLQVDRAFLSFAAGTYRSYCRFILSNYVEMIKTFILINAPAPIYYIWNYLLAPFVPTKTRAKVVILGSNWKEEILRHVDARALPVHWGGKLTDDDGDEMCSSRVVVPMRVPAEHYWDRKNDVRYTEHFRTLTIPAAKCASIYVHAAAGDVLEWMAFCEAAYVFSIEYAAKSDENAENGSIFVGAPREANAREEEVFPETEIAGNRWLPEDNAFACERSGTYLVCFHNINWFGRLLLRFALVLNGRKIVWSQK